MGANSNNRTKELRLRTSAQRKPLESHRHRMGVVHCELDEFDRRILDILQIDARLPLRKIGEAVHLSTAAVQRRVKRMETEGIISTSVTVLDPTKLGSRTTVIVEIALENERSDLLDKTRRQFLACPHVQQCYYVTGDADFVLIMNVGSMEEYGNIAQSLFHENPNVTRFRTLVALRNVKVGLNIPMSIYSSTRAHSI